MLDPAPPRHGAADDALERLHLLADGDPVSLVRAALQGAAWPQPLGRIAPPGLLDRAAAAAALTALAESGEVLQLAGAEPAWLSAARYAELRETVREQLDRRAAEHPLEPALPAGAVVPAGPGADALLARLAADGILERDGAHVLRAGARADATGGHTAEADALLSALADGGFTPPDLPALQLASGLAEREFAALGGRARARRPARPLRRRPGLLERALRARARDRRRALRASTARSPWPSCATSSARAGGSRRPCSSGSTPTASRGASKIAACCGAARPPRPSSNTPESSRSAREASRRYRATVRREGLDSVWMGGRCRGSELSHMRARRRRARDPAGDGERVAEDLGVDERRAPHASRPTARRRSRGARPVARASPSSAATA